MDAICEIGCIVCRLELGVVSPACPHHIDGKTKPGAHLNTIPLCGPHHQVASPTGEWATRHGPGRNAGRAAFEEAYGSEEELRQATVRLVKKMLDV